MDYRSTYNFLQNILYKIIIAFRILYFFEFIGSLKLSGQSPVHIGIYGRDSRIVSSSVPSRDRLISINASLMSVQFPPSLNMSGVEIVGFGNSSIDGGTICIIGVCSLFLDNTTIKESVGYRGGAIYMRCVSLQFYYFEACLISALSLN